MHLWAGGELKGGGVACLVAIGVGEGGTLAKQGSRRFRQRDIGQRGIVRVASAMRELWL